MSAVRTTPTRFELIDRTFRGVGILWNRVWRDGVTLTLADGVEVPTIRAGGTSLATAVFERTEAARRRGDTMGSETST